MDWKEIFSKFQLDTSKIFGKGDIPQKKIANVLESYAKNINRDDIMILVDDTVFGGAKDGLILAKQGLFCHTSFEKPRFIEINKINKIASEGRDIYINGEKFGRLDILDKKSIPQLCALLMEIASVLRNDNCQTITQEENSEENKSELISEEIKNILAESSFSSNRIFIYPDIPYSKSANVVDSYAKGVNVDEIILLYDDTALGGAKDGFIITSEKIYAHQFLMPPISINLNEIDFISTSDHDFLINGEKKFSASLLDDDNINKVSEFIEKICELININVSPKEKEIKKIITEICESRAFYFLSLIGNSDEYRELINPDKTNINIVNRISLSKKYDYNRDLRKLLNGSNDTILNTINAILLYVFNYQKLIPPCAEPTIDFLFKTDSIIHELLICLIYKGNSMIYQAFDDEAHRMAALSIFTEDVMYGKILLPFYKFILLTKPKPTSLRESAQFRDPPEIFKGVLKNRSLYNNFNTEVLPTYLRKLILDCLSYDHLCFNIPRVLSPDRPTSCDNNCSKLMSASYAIAYKAALEGATDEFLETFISESEGFLDNILVTLFNE